MLLIHPPVSKPCEPPAGIGRLCGSLRSMGIHCTSLDANLEGLLSRMHCGPFPTDTWTHRASRNLSFHLDSIRSWPAYRHFPRYKRAVLDLNRLLQAAGVPRVNLTLADYEHPALSPLRSHDLLQAAERPEDDPFFPYFHGRLIQMVERIQPKTVGLSLNYLSQALTTLAMAGFLKRIFPALTIVLGGGLVTSWLRRPGWRNPFAGLVDFLIAGPGEAPLLSILGIKDPMPEVQGVPDYQDFPLRDYFSPGFILPYSSSSGCYWGRCLFCPEKAEGNPYHSLPLGRVTADLKTLISRKKPVLIHFLDNAIPPVVLKELIRHPPGAPWYGFARITGDLADLDFCMALKKCGCVMLQVGLESGDQGVLDQLQKGVDVEVASRALKNLKVAGIGTYVYLLFGTPAETESEALRTLEFTARHGEQIGFLNLAIFNLPANGPEVERLKTGKFYQGDLSLYTGFSHPRGWDRNLVRAFLDREFKRHPAIAPIVRRDPPIFTSNHAPFFGEGMAGQTG